MAASYTFLPWIRQGIVSAISEPDSTNGSLKSRVELNVSVRLNHSTADDAAVKVRLYGPGDVTGFDHKQVIRTEPVHLNSDFEPNYFPFVEFDRPDFPWMFTPAKANAKDQLRPWICLIVVEQTKANLNRDPNLPLPVLTVSAKDELPDLNESWAWAHAQVTADSEGDIEKALADNPERTLSRLLCPRKLEEKKSYYACVVPTFEAGRKAGLGEEVHDGEKGADEFLQPAWAPDSGEIDIPVYYHWEFSTSATGDFESLVRLLQLRQLGSGEVGTREVQVQNPDSKNPWPAVPKIFLEGALRPFQDQSNGQNDLFEKVQNDPAYQQFQEMLRALLNKPEEPKSKVALPAGLPIAPPIYGRWHAGQKTIPDGKRDIVWLRELNLHPGHRAVAGIATQIIQDQQEHLMASAWEQVGEIEKANQILRQAQVARAAGTTIYEQHLNVLPPATFFAITGPVHSRVLFESARTIFARTADSRIPQSLAQGAFRRLVRPRGPLARRLKLYGGLQIERFLQRLDEGKISIGPSSPTPGGMVTMDHLLRDLEREDRFCTVTPDRVQAELQIPTPEELDSIHASLEQLLHSPDLPDELHRQLREAQRHFTRAHKLLPGISHRPVRLQEALNSLSAARDTLNEVINSLPADSELFPIINEIISALDRIIAGLESGMPRLLLGLALMEHQRGMEPCNPPPKQPKPKLDFSAIKTVLLERLNPEKTIKARIKSRIVAPPGWEPDDELEPILAAPEFPTPMYKPLAAFSQDLLLPGLEHVPPNTIALLETNPRFIEAFMIGLNHEMSRELLWREFPTDQRGTYFRQFWDPLGRVPQPATPEETEQAKDIKPITNTEAWKKNNRLGSSMNNGGLKGQTVMLIRGNLLQRYPRANIYAAKAEWVKNKQGQFVKDAQGRYVRRPAGEEVFPVFQGALAPDITFLGFELPTDPRGVQLDDSQAVNPEDSNAGWFFVLQQPLTEPRFGLDETVPGESAGTWEDISWQDLTLSGSGHITLANAFNGNFEAPQKPDNILWGSNANSASLAFITMQRSFRIAIHASDLLPVSMK